MELNSLGIIVFTGVRKKEAKSMVKDIKKYFNGDFNYGGISKVRYEEDISDYMSYIWIKPDRIGDLKEYVDRVVGADVYMKN